MSQFLQTYQQHRVQESSETRQKALNIFHFSLWKRIFNALFSLSTLVILPPLPTNTAIAIRLENEGEIVHESQRVGSDYRIFSFLKFRSMYTDADKRLKELNALNQHQMEKEMAEDIPDIHSDDLADSPERETTLLISGDFIMPEKDLLKQRVHTHKSPFVKIENDPHVARIGRFIHKYSIDEFPQLLNVLKGDMNTIGNRPFPLYEAELLASGVCIDHFMAPSGLTGLWQVERRGGVGKMSAEERKQLDIKYIQGFSFWLDLEIILRIFTAFVQKKNV